MRASQKAFQRKIQNLLFDIEKTPLTGIGKPEALKYRLSGKWSREIDKEHRLVYQVQDNNIIEVFSLKGHYTDLYL